DQRHQARGAADSGHRAGCDVEEIAACRLGRSCCHSPGPSLAVSPSARRTANALPKTQANARWRGSRPPQALGEDEKRLSGGVYWHPYKASASPAGPQWQEVAQILWGSAKLIVDAGPLSDETTPCGLPFTSPISRRTPARFCAWPHASASRPTS